MGNKKKRHYIYLCLLLFLFSGCKILSIPFPMPVLPFLEPSNWCDLPNLQQEEELYIRGILSGTDGDWSIRDPNGKCEEIQIHLEMPKQLYPEDLKYLKKINKKYKHHYLMIDVVGTFEMKNVSGYGRSGKNNTQFIANRIVLIHTMPR